MQNANTIQPEKAMDSTTKNRVLELESALAELIAEFKHFQIDEDLIKYEAVLRKKSLIARADNDRQQETGAVQSNQLPDCA